MRKLSHLITAVLTLTLLLTITGCGGPADGKTHLTFQIWDVYQRPGMEAMCKAYTAKHPDVDAAAVALFALILEPVHHAGECARHGRGRVGVAAQIDGGEHTVAV